jgi:3-hydroxyisobutyrate dehydrogenase-like beta-hydroxyacid dehydrogenase
VAFAKQLGVPLVLANVSQQVYRMGRAAGFSREDGSSLVKVYERLARVKVSDGEGG